LKIWRFLLSLFTHLEIENLTKPITSLATNKKFLKIKEHCCQERASQPMYYYQSNFSRVPEGQKLLATANQRVPGGQKLQARATHRVEER
jgi:hypothetical protein